MNVKTIWNEKQESELVKFYKMHGKRYSIISEEMTNVFGDPHRYVRGKINTRLHYLMRAGYMIFKGLIARSGNYQKTYEKAIKFAPF